MPTTPDYLDFDLTIARVSEGNYRARVTDSPHGQATSNFALAISPKELERLHVRVGGEHRRTSLLGSPQVAELKTFGGDLYERVFTANLRACLLASIQAASRQDKNLRLRLNLSDAPELAALPWEFLYDAATNRFFALSNETPLVRFFDLPDPLTPLRVVPPLRILVLLSPDENVDQAAADQDWRSLSDALQELRTHGLVELERMDKASVSALQALLRQREIHILHYIGHGAFNANARQGTLLLNDNQGQARAIRGDMLGTILHDHEPLRLVILNASEGARPDRDNLFGGVAQALIQQGIPAVIAMQSEITADAANAFAREFYRALADNYPIDAALAEARKAIYVEGNDVEWATPVLYSRAPDGVLFDIRGARSNAQSGKLGTSGDVNIVNIGAGAQVGQVAVGKEIAQTSGEAEAQTFDELLRRAITAQNRAEQIWHDTPLENDAWRKKFEEAYALLERADKLRPDDVAVLLRMAQVQARLDPSNAKSILYHLEDVIGEPMTDDQVRKLGEAFFLHATLSEPPSENLLNRARPLFEQLNDAKKLHEIDTLLQKIKKPNAASLSDFYGNDTFMPVGRWNIQVQDMVGSRLLVEFKANGAFEMLQQVGMYRVPVNGSWTFNPITRELAVQGVINTFQPFILALTLGSKLPNGFSATGSDGIGYVLTQAN